MPTCSPPCITFIRRSMDNPNLDMFRDWASYKAGFGDPNADFIMGLEELHQLTKNGDYKVKIYAAGGASCSWADYDHFSIGPESDFYRINMTGYNPSSELSNVFDDWNQNGQPFSTHDQDNRLGGRNGVCLANGHYGGWWYLGDCAATYVKSSWSQTWTAIGSWYGLRNYMEWRLIPKNP